MEIKLKPGEVLRGIKIFDGIDKKTKLPYCQPDKNKQIYQLGENKYDGKIGVCRAGFHFCLDLASASDYKYLFKSHVVKKYPNAVIISPVFYVTAKDEIQSDEYERKIDGVFTCKYVTNNLNVCRQLNYSEIMYCALEQSISSFPHSLLNKPEISTHEINLLSNQPYYFNRCLIQTFAKDVTIDRIPNDYNHTIFSNTSNLLTVRNKTKYTQYVNRYDCAQYITPVPRYSTVEFKQFDKFGKIVN